MDRGTRPFRRLACRSPAEHDVASERLLQALRLVALDVGWTPSDRECDAHASCGRGTPVDRFGGWNAANEVAPLDLAGKREADRAGPGRHCGGEAFWNVVGPPREYQQSTLVRLDRYSGFANFTIG